MPSHRAPKFSSRKTSAFAVAGVAAGSVLLMQGSAHAETLTQAKTDYNQKLEKSEAATEAYDAANTQAATLQQKVNTLQGQISTDTAAMSSLERTMGLQAAQQYEGSGMSSTLELAFESSPSAYLDKALTSNEIATKEAQLLKTLSDDKAQIAADQKLAASELAQKQAAVATAQKQKSTALSEAASAKSTLDSLTTSQQQAIQQTEQGVSASTVHITQTASSSRGAAAVAYAMSKLGDNYVYAAAGPSEFDCSGLTMEAWAAAGVSLDHNAAAQYDETVHVSVSDLVPGDLLFYDYGEGITHVAIYVGNGMAIHAPHTGTDVQYGSINNIGPLVGASDPALGVS
jgi:cell wall-associated NlpC family hydrolase